MSWPQQLSIADATDEHYAEVIALLQRARVQHQWVRAGLAEPHRALLNSRRPQQCSVCGDNDHTAESCRHNPLLLAIVGRDALDGCVWKCFHCEAVFCDEESAERHFGVTPEFPPACIAGVPEYEPSTDAQPARIAGGAP